MESCKIAKKCGSCQYIELPYQEQLKKKKEECIKLVKHSTLKQIEVQDVVGMNFPFQYRNKIIVAFNQKYEYGLYEENSHKIIPYQFCLLHEKESDQIIQKIQTLFKRYKVSIYDEKRNSGLVRHVMIRRAVATNQTMVVLVCTDTIFKGSKNFCNELVKVFPSIKTIVLNVNKRKTSIVLGEEEKTLYGKGFIVDQLSGLSFKISAKSFYQINHDQCEALYQKAISLIELKRNETVIDAYCGIGTIGMLVAKSVEKVIGVEVNKDAIKDAITNAKHNQIDNIHFICKDATAYIKELSEQKEQIDVIIIDPPRLGTTKELIDSIQKLNVKKVVYISCNPETQVRDLEYFYKLGYQTNIMYPYDMFPHTKHVESVVLLTKK